MTGVLPMLLTAVLAAGPNKKSPPPAAPRPVPISRTLSITDENARAVHQLHLAAGEATWLLLPLPLARNPSEAWPAEFGDVQQQGQVLIFTPRAPVPAERALPLLLPLAGGGPPLIFEVRAAADSYDARVTIDRRLATLAAQDSPEVLGDRLQQCRDELQEVRTGAAGLDVLTGALADLGRGKSPTLVRKEVGTARRQNFIYVRVQETYRLFHWTFVTLELQNRQEGTLWVLGDASVRQMGVETLLPSSVRHERPAGIRGGESERLVIGFATPADNTKLLAITLTDKAGTRNVALEDLDL